VGERDLHGKKDTPPGRSSPAAEVSGFPKNESRYPFLEYASMNLRNFIFIA
jgi:hypothetical protein